MKSNASVLDQPDKVQSDKTLEKGRKKFRFIKSKEQRKPWKPFLIKTTVLLTVMGIGMTFFLSRYRIGYDDQIIKCIPGYTMYLIDKKDTVVKRDAIYAFKAKGLEPIFKEGTQMVKFARGLPNDQIEVTPGDYKVLINHHEIARGLPLADRISRPSDSFVGKGVLKDSQYWFFGTHPESFDSRYWGVVHEEQIVGRAYPLF